GPDFRLSFVDSHPRAAVPWIGRPVPPLRRRLQHAALLPPHRQPLGARALSRLAGSPRGGGLRRFAALAVATAAGAGLAPVAPGTFGSLVGVGVFALIAPFGAFAV